MDDAMLGRKSEQSATENGAGTKPPYVPAAGERLGDIRSWRARLQFYSELRELLIDDGLSHALWWKDGYVFLHAKNFVRDVMQKYFSTTKLCSFQRRLNRWGFFRVRFLKTNDPELLIYKNPDFELHPGHASVNKSRSDVGRDVSLARTELQARYIQPDQLSVSLERQRQLSLLRTEQTIREAQLQQALIARQLPSSLDHLELLQRSGIPRHSRTGAIDISISNAIAPASTTTTSSLLSTSPLLLAQAPTLSTAAVVNPASLLLNGPTFHDLPISRLQQRILQNDLDAQDVQIYRRYLSRHGL